MAILFALFHSWTLVICEAGGFGCELVVMPSPSLMSAIPHMGEKGWEEAVADGRIPSWVVEKRYTVLATSDEEMPTKLWQPLYGSSLIFIFVMFLVAVYNIGQVGIKKFRTLSWFDKM